MVKLYFITGKKEYLDFAEYIVTTGASKGSNMFQQVYEGTHLYEVGKPYPKAYEMTSVWEGLAEYYRATGDPRWKVCLDNFFNDVIENEITIIGNAGSDVYWPRLNGEGWSNTAVEQTNPNIKRMMETCVGVTWMKYCSQYLRLTGDPTAVDYIEKYAYNGLLGAMIDGQPVTCCNLSGPCGLSYLPYIAAMQSKEGPVINLYNAGTVTAKTAKGNEVKLGIVTEYPRANEVRISVDPAAKEKFTVKLHIPSWSEQTYVAVNGKYVGIIHPYAAYDLKTSKEFIEVHKYADPDTMFRGEIGKLGNIRFIETSEAKIWKDSTCPDGLAVFGTLVLGAHAYGVTELEGGGLEHIVKQLGYGDDPLNQRASVGWKGMRAAERLVEQYMVRIESASSYSATAAAN